ncbi:uncharacterized protein CIMG_10756 [Coccidioides immitis RS]|uniref:Uncharacterized protein n=1 Tax=Coccidioides immitis (strain RS) TaxID=246410 RepID=A0A0D8JS51_COCIM|nr:uncharacterized protein CIMG_10756 [Coccidioides immitis RS]KJF60155.1 hypothetical protein CIMG_10756 [Coccidioides immitis RS]
MEHTTRCPDGTWLHETHDECHLEKAPNKTRFCRRITIFLLSSPTKHVASHAGAGAVAIAAHQALPTAFGLVAAAGVRAAKQVRPRGIAWLCSMT